MNFKIFIARQTHKFLQHTELMTENMRSPRTIGLAWVARTLMNYSNAQVSIDIVNRMKLKKTDHVLELGVGNGLAIKEIAKISENKIIGIEISAEFRKKLLSKQLPKKPGPTQATADQSSSLMGSLGLTDLGGQV